MASQQTPTMPSKTSSDAEDPGENEILAEKDANNDAQDHHTKDEGNSDNLRYLMLWKPGAMEVWCYGSTRTSLLGAIARTEF